MMASRKEELEFMVQYLVERGANIELHQVYSLQIQYTE